VLPVVAVSGARAARLLVKERALQPAWYELSLAAAALLAVGAASVATYLIRSAGGYVLSPGVSTLVPAGMMPSNARGVFRNFLGVFSADFFGQRLGNGLAFTAIHLVAAALVAVSIYLGLRRLFGGEPLAPMLAVAICANVLAYALIFPVTGATIREMAPVFALGGALAGRVLAEPLLRHRLEPLLVPGLACAVWAATPGVLLATPGPTAGTDLASWLEQHGLRQGLAGYWQASPVTLDSGGQVTVRPVRVYPTLGVAPQTWELDQSLLDSRTYDVNFLVVMSPGAQGGATVTEQAGIAKFGGPYRVYQYRQYRIMVWRKNLLPELTGELLCHLRLKSVMCFA
jgi:hypothetical protein